MSSAIKLLKTVVRYHVRLGEMLPNSVYLKTMKQSEKCAAVQISAVFESR